MQTKMFELRDEGTMIPVLAIRLRPGCEEERWLLGRAGYTCDRETQASYVFLCRLAGGECGGTYDPFGWKGCRTMTVAHHYIREHFDALPTGAVIDVQYLLGERQEPKRSERLADVLSPA